MKMSVIPPNASSGKLTGAIVIILGYETHFHFETQDAPDTVRAKVLRRSPRPILVVPRELQDGRAESTAELAAEYLEAHGTDCKVHVVKSDREPAETLLQQVRLLKPRLMVMGAHAHHPLRDLFATSVTRAVLQASPVPVLIGS